ncbi:MAG: ABC-F family ATP-binding cassette domain-containing protein [Chloroherpetonaceae bacterium]|nr:ABC-F family ATP-binding cassette domain-containing protein [Chloroherpetonaceae bacterium]
MLEARNLNLTIGTKELLTQTSFRIGDRDRVGLVGVNGAGKSTLLKWIAGYPTEQTLHVEGEILKSSDTTIGYLPQEISFEGDLEKSALEYVMEANARLHQLSREIARMEVELTLPIEHESEAYTRLIERFSDATAEFERLGGYKLRADAEKVLIGLGFSEDDFHKPVKAFSGGWQMRLLIAKLLLQNPTLLLLDEPTNHLDMDSLRWLENYLLNYDGAFVIVSHDRFFLDKLTTKTLEISFRRITEYKGNYSFYETEKALRYEQMQAKYENDLKRIEHLRRFVERFKAKATKASQAQSRMRMIEKIQAQLEAPEQDLSQIAFRFPKAAPSGRIVLRLENVSKSYALPDHSQKLVLKDINLEIERGERLALVGSNGVGKSTLCKIIAGEIDFEGRRILGHNVKYAFFGQHQAERLNPQHTVLEEMLEAAPDSEARKKVRDILGCFLFSGDAVNKKISVLSGGEKSRVALAKLLLQAANFLILDEPTNHLNMRSKEMLIESLENYDGTLILVSHDRYFLDCLVSKVLYLKEGRLHIYQGSYAEFLEKLEAEQAQMAAQAQASAKAAHEMKKESAPRKPSEPNKDLQKRLQKLEARIEALEQEKALLEQEMMKEDFYKHDASRQTLEKHRLLCEELEGLYRDWESMAS